MKHKPPLIVLISLLIFPLGGAFAQWTQQSAPTNAWLNPTSAS